VIERLLWAGIVKVTVLFSKRALFPPPDNVTVVVTAIGEGFFMVAVTRHRSLEFASALFTRMLEASFVRKSKTFLALPELNTIILYLYTKIFILLHGRRIGFV
jgi:hypothetical protein